MASSMSQEGSPQARDLSAVSKGTSTSSTRPSGWPKSGESSGSHFRVQVEFTLGSQEQLTQSTLLVFQPCSLFLPITRLSKPPQTSAHTSTVSAPYASD